MKRRFIVNQAAVPRTRAAHTVYGVHAVAARLALNPPQVEQLYVREDPSSRVAALAAAAAARGVIVSHVPSATLSHLCGSEQHQGVVASVPPFRYRDVDEVITRGAGRVLVLDQLRDPQNLGALMRSAEAAGFDAVIVPKDGAVGITASVEKAAAGAAMRVAMVRVTNVARTLQELKQRGYWVVGLAARVVDDVFAFDPPERMALVLGGESGLRRLVQEACDQLLSIPMAGQTESLNASVAGAVAMYALRRRRGPALT